MKLRNVIFAAVTPIIVIALIAAIVSGFGVILLAIRYWAEAQAHDHRISEEAARLYPVAVAMAVATVFLIGGTVASRMAPPAPSHDADLPHNTDPSHH